MVLSVEPEQVWLDEDAARKRAGRVRLLKVVSAEPRSRVLLSVLADTHGPAGDSVLIAPHRMAGRSRQSLDYRMVQGSELEALLAVARRRAT